MWSWQVTLIMWPNPHPLLWLQIISSNKPVLTDVIALHLPMEIAQITPIYTIYKSYQTSKDLPHNLFMLLSFYLTAYFQIHWSMWLSGFFRLLAIPLLFWHLEFLRLYENSSIKDMQHTITNLQHCTASWRPCSLIAAHARLLLSFFRSVFDLIVLSLASRTTF